MSLCNLNFTAEIFILHNSLSLSYRKILRVKDFVLSFDLSDEQEILLVFLFCSAEQIRCSVVLNYCTFSVRVQIKKKRGSTRSGDVGLSRLLVFQHDQTFFLLVLGGV